MSRSSWDDLPAQLAKVSHITISTAGLLQSVDLMPEDPPDALIVNYQHGFRLGHCEKTIQLLANTTFQQVL